MTTSDLTVEILREIRDEARQTNRRLAAVESRLGSMDQRLGRTEQGLSDLGQFMRQIALDKVGH